MTLRVYNTLSRKKEPFETIDAGRVLMYVCGPTVYDKAHVGHAMSSLVFDIIRRYLEHRGYQVQHVMNYTDVDDKIIQRAGQLGLEPLAIAQQYIDEYQDHLHELNILPPTVIPRATQEIDTMLQMIEGLVDRDFAYAVDGDVYFRVTRDEDYGKLSGRRIEDMRAGARIDVDERKVNPLDFALWKAARPGEPSWESPWGAGRPGWHIECSAMSLRHLGEQIDIHGGGNDLVFPHHENEIAQIECLTGKPFARYWIHNGMLQLAGEKMSKSLGNLVTIEDFLADHEAEVLRLMVLNSSYRHPLTFTDEVIEQAERALERLRSALRPDLPQAAGANAGATEKLETQTKATQAGFVASMDDDINTAGALGHLFNLVRAINQARDAGASAEQLGKGQAVLLELAGVFGLRLERPVAGAQATGPYIDLLVETRTELRRQQQWSLADLIRDRLASLGVILEDHQDGSSWHWE
jgi:cysteinyl-tRNA synthetase